MVDRSGLPLAEGQTAERLIERALLPEQVGARMVPVNALDVTPTQQARHDQLVRAQSQPERAEAAEHKRSWNIFHVPTATRIDLFVLKDDEYAVEAFFRRVKWTISEGQTLHVMSAEDTVLQKLLWFRAGGEQSERQLRDVADVLRVQSGRLDERYLETWARKLGLEGLLTRARGTAE